MKNIQIFLILVIVGFSIPIMAVKGDNYLIGEETFSVVRFQQTSLIPVGNYSIQSLNTSNIERAYSYIKYTQMEYSFDLDATANNQVLFINGIVHQANHEWFTLWLIVMIEVVPKEAVHISYPMIRDFDSRLSMKGNGHSALMNISWANNNYTQGDMITYYSVTGVGTGIIASALLRFTVITGVNYIDVTPDIFNRIMHPETFEDLMLFIILFPFTLMFHNHWFLFFLGLAIAFIELVILIAIIRRLKEYLW